VGAEYVEDFRQQQINYDLSPYVQYLDEEHPEEAVGVYAQDEFRVRPSLSLVGGLRMDWKDFLDSNVSPRVGLVYSPDESTHFKLMYSQAFRQPNAYESYYVSSVSNTASTDLGAELVHTLEFELERNFAKRYDFITSLYANRFHDLIDQQSSPGTGRLSNTNSSEVLHNNGLELEFDANCPGGIKGQLSYSLQSSRYFPGGQMATNSPAQLVKARLLLPIVQNRLSAAFDDWYTDRLLSVSGVELGSSFVANATLLARGLHKNFEVSASVHNLFNKYYADPGGFEHHEVSIPQDRRTAQLQLTYRFPSKTR